MRFSVFKARLPIFATVVAVAWVPTLANAAGTLNIQKIAPYAKNMPVPQAVRTDCTLESKIPEFVRDYAKKGFDKVELVNKATGKGKNLSMKIIGLQGTAGGAWTGAKSVSVEGTLFENGKKVGSFKAARMSGGGAFGGYKGTCSILGRSAKAVGKDISRWLQDPVDGAKLGDFR